MKLPALYLFLPALLSACTTEADHHSHDETESHEHEGVFVIDSLQSSKFGFEFETAEPAEFSTVIRVSGEIETSGSDIFTVSAKKSGIFTFAENINLGSPIRKGVPLGTISSQGVQGGDPERIAELNYESARIEFERLKPLYEDGLVTASEFNEAKRIYQEAQASLPGRRGSATYYETSPIDGYITQLLVTSGNYVDVGTPIAIIAGNSRLNLRADLPARYASYSTALISANVRPEGSEETLSLDSLGGKRLSSPSSLTASNGFIPIYFSFTGSPQIFPGGFAEVYLKGEKRNDVISVPRSSLVEIQGKYYLYVAHHDNEYEKRLVETGASDGIRVEIVEGLSSGERYLSKGASVARMAETSAIAPPSHSHNH